jgi:hypothetical protein
LRYASVTARAQARAGGRIPLAFRDGALRLRLVSSAATGYSAQVTVSLANRSESYPTTVQLLLTQFGWQVAQVQIPDLDIDDPSEPVAGPPIPAAGQVASRRFTLAYVAYRADHGPLPAGMTATARRELQDGQDDLFGLSARHRTITLQSVRYGPLEGSEFAVTATVRIAGRATELSFLMLDVAHRWECDAFL